MTAATGPAATDLLIEAEDFDDIGGWTVDSQFEVQMGSPYLLAHGLGRPVADARTVATIAEAGTYEVWVRTKDWAPGPLHAVDRRGGGGRRARGVRRGLGVGARRHGRARRW